MKKILCLVLLLTASVFAASCEPKEKYIEATFLAMDTEISIKIADDEYDELAMIAECEKLVKNIESVVVSNTAIANDDIGLFIDVDPVFAELIALSITYSDMTDGFFDITVGGIKELWERCSAEGREPHEGEIALALEAVGYEKISLEDGSLKKEKNFARIDLSDILKGYAAQKVCDYLSEVGARGAVVSFGENIAFVGSQKSGKPYSLGIKDSENESKTVCDILLEGGFVSVACDLDGDIIDPFSGGAYKSDIRSVYVISDDGAMAAAFSVALFGMGKDAAMDFYSRNPELFEAVIITDDGMLLTDGIKDSVKTK